MSNSNVSLDRAIQGVAGLKAGSWTSVEALALLAVETGDRSWLVTAQEAAAGLKGAGTWEAVRALATLARAEREIN